MSRDRVRHDAPHFLVITQDSCVADEDGRRPTFQPIRASERSVSACGKLGSSRGIWRMLKPLARPAVMAGGVAFIGDSSLLLPALRTPGPIRAPPRLRPLLP
jgi:hypothetical protein